jgi:hypothetical protein
MPIELDQDIKDWPLTEPEKQEMQGWRNLKRAYDYKISEMLQNELDREPFDLTPLKKVIRLVQKEDVRSLPVIACGFADSELEEMFKEIVSSDVSGGRRDFMGAYGPVSSLANKLKLSQVFKMIASNIILDLESLRQIRNRIAHDWDVESLKSFTEEKKIADLFHFSNLAVTDKSLEILGL